MSESHVAIVTGAAAGIGAAICMRLVARGVKVHGLDLRCCEIRGVHGHVVDLDDAAALSTLLERIGAKDGPADLVVNNAARSGRAAEHDLTAPGAPGHFNAMVKTNLLAPFFVIHFTAAALIRAHRPGRIVNIASAAAHRGGLHTVGYAATKAAVVGLSRAAAVELGPYNINVNSVSPGYVATETATREYPLTNADAAALNPLGRPSLPDEVAGLIEYLLLDAPILISGADYRIDGGATIA